MTIATPDVNGLQGASSAASSGFSKERRVRRRVDFQQVFDRGTRIQGRYFTVLFLPNKRPSSRLGLVASRKLGGAVERNRAKRLIREVFRREIRDDREPAVDAVVIPRREMLDAVLTSLVQDFKNIWRRGIDRVSPRVRS